jgi:hypothetical protein
VDVDAVEQTIYMDIVRSLGSVGTISVDVVTQSASAVGQTGPTMYLSVMQEVVHCQKLVHFSEIKEYRFDQTIILIYVCTKINVFDVIFCCVQSII